MFFQEGHKLGFAQRRVLGQGLQLSHDLLREAECFQQQKGFGIELVGPRLEIHQSIKYGQPMFVLGSKIDGVEGIADNVTVLVLPINPG